MRDVASTLAVLGGLRPPSSNLGRPMLDALGLDDEQNSFLLAGPFDEAAHFLCRLHPGPRCAEIDPLVARLHKPDPTAWEEAVSLHAELSRDRDRDLDARTGAGRPLRLGVTAALIALAACRSCSGWPGGACGSPRALAFTAVLAPLAGATPTCACSGRWATGPRSAASCPCRSSRSTPSAPALRR